MHHSILSLLLCPFMSLFAVAQQPDGAIEGLFSIAADKQVYFSQGVLIHNEDIWSFAENQYAVPDASGLFAWGTSGYGTPDTIPVNKGLYYNGLWGGATYANFDWGVFNPISNGGNVPGQWRTLTGEEWQYLLTHYTTEWTTIEGTAGLKVMADDNTHYLFLPGGYYWTATSGTDHQSYKTAEAYHFAQGAQEKSPLMDMLGNEPRTATNYVRLVYDVNNPAWITVSDRENNATLLNQYKKDGTGSEKGKNINVHVIRTLTPCMSNTLTLPFDVSADELKAICGTDYQLWQLNTDNPGSINVEAQTFDVNMTSCTDIKAGVPYLITPTQTVTDMHFYNRVIEAATNDECIAGTDGALVQLCGLLDRTHLDAGKNYLFLYPNNTLTWPSDNDTGSMYSLRAYFKVNSPAQASAMQRLTPRMQVSATPLSTSGATDLHSVPHDANSKCLIHSSKLIKNGRLVIIREGKEYNAQGTLIIKNFELRIMKALYITPSVGALLYTEQQSVIIAGSPGNQEGAM